MALIRAASCLAMARTTVFSLVLRLPTAPGSAPPCPGSMTTTSVSWCFFFAGTVFRRGVSFLGASGILETDAAPEVLTICASGSSGDFSLKFTRMICVSPTFGLEATASMPSAKSMTRRTVFSLNCPTRTERAKEGCNFTAATARVISGVSVIGSTSTTNRRLSEKPR